MCDKKLCGIKLALVLKWGSINIHTYFIMHKNIFKMIYKKKSLSIGVEGKTEQWGTEMDKKLHTLFFF